MNCTINVYLLNDHFSQEHADAHHEGAPSENNRKYLWEDELNIKSKVTDIQEHKMVGFPLQGVLPNGEQFNHQVQNMRLFEITSKNEAPTFVGCSESILESTSINRVNDSYELVINIKDNEPLANPIPGIYIASKEFPKELIF